MLDRASYGFVLTVLVLVAIASGCGAPALLQCRVEAVKMLPDDPMQLTFGDVADLTQRLHACKAQGDAGQ
jgi:hypothetical protein